MTDTTTQDAAVKEDGAREATAKRIAGMFDSATVGDPIGDTVVVTGFNASPTGPQLVAEFYVDAEGNVTRRGQPKPKRKLSVL